MFNYFKEESLITPSKIIRKINFFPEIAIVTWQKEILNRLQTDKNINLKPLNIPGTFVSKELQCGNFRVAVCLIPIGSPAVATFMEEMIVLGVRKFVFTGSCGVLEGQFTDASGEEPGKESGGKQEHSGIIVPDLAFRDEGTSWHYIPSGDEFIEIKTARTTCKMLDEMKVEYSKGHVWTTDAVYRETPSAVEYYRSKGCICVDMECAAITAVAESTNVETYQFFFTADSLNKNRWEEGRLFRMGKASWEYYAHITLELARRIQ